MDAQFTTPVSQLYNCAGSEVERQAANAVSSGVRCGRGVSSSMTQKKRARLMAVLLALVAAGLYFGFMWMTANGHL